MKPIKLSDNHYFFLFSLVIIALGTIIFEQRTLDATSPLHTLGIDEQNYIKLSMGDSNVVKLHECRVLLPFIASKLPFETIHSIFFINIISFFFLIFYICRLLSKFSIPKKVIMISVLITSSSFSVAYNFTNFFLTDLPGLCTIVILLFSIINKNYYSSIFWMSISLLFRESAIIFLPLFFISFSKKKFVLSLLISLGVYIIPKLIIAQNINCGFDNKITIGHLMEYEFLAKTFLSYNFIILIGFFGFLELRKYKNHQLKKIAILILFFGTLGAFFSSLKSFTDVTRMYFILYPIINLGLALIVKYVVNLKYMLLKLFLLYISTIISTLGLLPNFFIGGNFDSLQKFAESNFLIITLSIGVQGIISLMIMIDYIKDTKLKNCEK